MRTIFNDTEDNNENDNDGDNVAKIFFDDTKEKKVIGQKRIITKKDKLPTNKEVIAKAGEVVISSIYDTIMPLNEFNELSKEEQRVVINEYWKRFAPAFVSEAWGKPKRFSLDKHYLLNKDEIKLNKDGTMKRKYTKRNQPVEIPVVPMLEQLEIEEPTSITSEIGFSDLIIESEPVTTEPVTYTIEPIIEYKEKEYSIKIEVVKELSGENMQDFIIRLLEIFDEESKVEVDLVIKKSTLTKFNFTIDVKDTFSIQVFSDEILNTVASFSKDEMFRLDISIKEIIK